MKLFIKYLTKMWFLSSMHNYVTHCVLPYCVHLTIMWFLSSMHNHVTHCILPYCVYLTRMWFLSRMHNHVPFLSYDCVNCHIMHILQECGFCSMHILCTSYKKVASFQYEKYITFHPGDLVN